MVDFLKVAGTQLVNKATGRPVKLQGVSTHGLQWYPQFVNVETFKTLRDEWGVNVVRLAMYVEEGGFCQDGGLNGASCKTMLAGIDAAIALDMYCIVDWHVSNSDQLPMKHLSDAQGFFVYISGKYGNCPNILYELCNEPNGACTDYGYQIAPYVDQVIPTIRANAPDAICIIGSPMWSQKPYEAWQFDQQHGGRQNVMYTLHRYCEDNQNPSIGFEKWSPDIWTANAAGCPIFATECGVSNPEETDWNCAAEFEKIAGFYDSMRIPWTVWSACDKSEPSSIFQSGSTNPTAAGEVVKGALLKYAVPKSSTGTASNLPAQTPTKTTGDALPSSTGSTASPTNPVPPAPVQPSSKGTHMGISVDLDPSGTQFTIAILDASSKVLASAALTPPELKSFADYLETQASVAPKTAAAPASLAPTAHPQAGVQTFGLLDGIFGGGGGPFGGGGLFPHPPWGGGYPGQWGGGGYYPQYPQYPSQPVIVAPQQPVYIPQPAPQPVVVQQPVYQPIPAQAPVVVERPVWRGGPIWGR
jgi:hypothetical protein